ncbi:hypothetical protein OKA05_22585 [Luteolibacter arcticus]|uniref:DUF4034 domain-containing protein n=1 Tax=Luteolibacter arcticus TaxID=1581411 RepID=A0ABT3GPC1_9BACT|nr:hypothetical protein [Luteolibacter arcticus]MCW1925365.1 hypothetical protein [Luteolibacter arcticus]
MKELSRRSLSWLCVGGFVLAGAGWTKAWMNGRALEEAGGKSSSEDAPRNGKSAPRAPSDRLAMVSDPRSQRLLAWMSEMDASAQPGKPNPAFVKAAVTTLDDSLFHRRQRDFRLLMEKLRPEDARAIHDHFKSLERDGRYFGDEYAAFAMRWGQIAGGDALNEWLQFAPPDRSHGNLISLMTGWGTSEPEKALAWVEEHQSEFGGMNAYRPLLVGWLNADPMAATAWLQSAKLDPQQLADCVGGAMLDKVYSDGLEGASEWLASLPDDSDELATGARIGWISNVRNMRNLDPQKAANAWSKVGGQSWMKGEDFKSFCAAVAAGNGGSLDEFAQSLGTTWPSGEVAAQFERWAATNGATMSDVLKSLPPSDLREAGMTGLFRHIEKFDPARVEVMRKDIIGE